MENWKQIDGAVGCWVSDQGRVRSHTGCVLRPFLTGYKGKKYETVSLCFDGERRAVKVHHLVLLAFVGPRPAGSVGRHLNDNQFDNRAGNLAWGTSRQNVLDRVRNGRSSQQKLSVEQMREIAERRKTEPGKALAAEFGVSQQTVCDIFRGRKAILNDR